MAQTLHPATSADTTQAALTLLEAIGRDATAPELFDQGSRTPSPTTVQLIFSLDQTTSPAAPAAIHSAAHSERMKDQLKKRKEDDEKLVPDKLKKEQEKAREAVVGLGDAIELKGTWTKKFLRIGHRLRKPDAPWKPDSHVPFSAFCIPDAFNNVLQYGDIAVCSSGHWDLLFERTEESKNLGDDINTPGVMYKCLTCGVTMLFTDAESHITYHVGVQDKDNTHHTKCWLDPSCHHFLSPVQFQSGNHGSLLHESVASPDPRKEFLDKYPSIRDIKTQPS